MQFLTLFHRTTSRGRELIHISSAKCENIVQSNKALKNFIFEIKCNCQTLLCVIVKFNIKYFPHQLHDFLSKMAFPGGWTVFPTWPFLNVTQHPKQLPKFGTEEFELSTQRSVVSFIAYKVSHLMVPFQSTLTDGIVTWKRRNFLN